MYISPDDTKLLKDLSNTFLNPCEHDETESWLGSLNKICRELTQAERSTFFLPDHNLLYYYSEDADPAAIDILKATVSDIPHVGDLAISDDLLRRGHLKRRRMAPMVTSFDQFESIFPGKDVSEFDIFNDVIVPGGLAYPIAMAVPLNKGESIQSMLYAKRPAYEVIEKAMFLLEKALPSFICGVNGYLSVSAVRHSLYSAFDNFKEAVLIVTTDNQLVYTNESWQSYLDDEEERDMLKSFVHCLGAEQLSSLQKKKGDKDFSSPLETLKTNMALYKAEVFYLSEQTLGKLYLAIRIFRKITGFVRSAALLFSLSARECEVAEHLIRGESNKSIAKHLFISEFTVRRHVESILRKLRISSRAAVLPALLQAV